jgi:hypothetical protein
MRQWSVLSSRQYKRDVARSELRNIPQCPDGLLEQPEMKRARPSRRGNLCREGYEEFGASCTAGPAGQTASAFPIFLGVKADNLAISLQPRPPSADRTRSPSSVSGKRELFNESPETFGIFGRLPRKLGAWRPVAELQKPAIGGLFFDGLRPNRDRPDCLAGDAVLIAPVSTQIPC